MRDVTLTKDEFDDTFFPLVTSGRTPAKDENEHEIALRLIRVLKDPMVTFPEDPKPDAIKQIEASGNRWWPSYKLIEDSHTFEFEEDVYKIVRHRLKEAIPHIHPMMQEEFDVVWQQVKGAEFYDAAKEEEPTEDEPEGEGPEVDMPVDDTREQPLEATG